MPFQTASYHLKTSAQTALTTAARMMQYIPILDHTSIILLLFKVEPEWVGRVEIQNDCAPIGRTIGILSAYLQIIEICGGSIAMTIDCKADNGMIALCGWAASPWLFFDLIPPDDAYNSTGFNRCPGSETPGLGKPYEKAYPTNE